MMKELMITFGENRYLIKLKATITSDGIIIIVGGGEKPHVGAAVMALPTPSGYEIKEVSAPQHKDAVAFKPMAQLICQAAGEKVVIVGGIHIDNATKEEIDILLNYSLKAAQILIEKLVPGTL
ncbi:MAG: gallate decarboxylase subunit [Clostridia bacterium]|jgi:hypothetical protein|nr:gallate decarboxylase subunit [Clostridia bacterium]MDN5321945.1 gallate decarboxylase subunit [Clostridia bacterium]